VPWSVNEACTAIAASATPFTIDLMAHTRNGTRSAEADNAVMPLTVRTVMRLATKHATTRAGLIHSGHHLLLGMMMIAFIITLGDFMIM